MASSDGSADVFVNPEGLFDRLVLFTDEAIVVANPEAGALAALKPGSGSADWKAVIGQSFSILPYTSIRKISTNKHGDTLSVRWKDTTRDRLTSICLKDAVVRDQAWDRLRRRLGQGFRVSDVQFGPVRAAVAPMAVVALCVFLTWIVHMAAGELAAGAEPEVRGRNQVIKQLVVLVVSLIGPTGVLIVGGLATVMAAAWAVARVRVPPRMLTLARR
jgi:hypothetical protein